MVLLRRWHSPDVIPKCFSPPRCPWSLRPPVYPSFIACRWRLAFSRGPLPAYYLVKISFLGFLDLVSLLKRFFPCLAGSDTAGPSAFLQVFGRLRFLRGLDTLFTHPDLFPYPFPRFSCDCDRRTRILQLSISRISIAIPFLLMCSMCIRTSSTSLRAKVDNNRRVFPALWLW